MTILLQRYFAQVLAGMTNAAIVMDPNGFVRIGATAKVPFLLTEADIRADVIVLGEMAGVFDVSVVSPDGRTVSASSGLEEVSTPTHRVLRVVPSSAVTPGAAAGEWIVALTVNSGRVQKWLDALEKRLDSSNIPGGDRIAGRVATRLKAHGVGFTLTIQARSSLRMDVSLTQASRRPGGKANLVTTLTDSGVALGSSVKISCSTTDPLGAVPATDLVQREPGVFALDISTPSTGVYRVLVRCR
jgi:hypothetical protein